MISVMEHTGFFRSVYSRFMRWFGDDKPETELIDYVITTVEPKLKRVKNYKKRLQEPLKRCRGHCRSMVEEIPGPIYIQGSGNSDNPVIKAIFSGSEGITSLLQRIDENTPKLALTGNRRVALVTMTSREKTIFGRKKKGNMIVADAAMRAITFYDHNIVGLAGTLIDSKEELENFCLEIIAEATARELSEIRTKLVDLRQRKERLCAMQKMFGDNSGGMGCVFVPYDPEREKKKTKLAQMLVETETEIADACSRSETPEDWLKIVEDFLSKPEDILSMRLVSLRLDWSNVLTDDPAEQANTITLATFTLADEMQREGVLIAYKQV